MNNAVVITLVLIVFVGVLVVGGLALGSWRSREAARERAIARRLGTLEDSAEDSLFRARSRDPMAAQLGTVGADLDALLTQADVRRI